MTPTDLNDVRRRALDRIVKSQKQAKLWLTAAGAAEAIVFVAVIFTIDFGEQLHRSIFLCTM